MRSSTGTKQHGTPAERTDMSWRAKAASGVKWKHTAIIDADFDDASADMLLPSVVALLVARGSCRTQNGRTTVVSIYVKSTH